MLKLHVHASNLLQLINLLISLMIASCRKQYDLPYLCQYLRQCPCARDDSNDVINVYDCASSYGQEDFPFFISEKPSNGTLLYQDANVKYLESGSLSLVRIARVEIRAKNLLTVGNDVFNRALIDSIKLNFDNPNTSNPLYIKSDAFRGWNKGLNPDLDCRIRPNFHEPWYKQISKHCRSLELTKRTPIAYHTEIRPEIFPEIKNLERLVIDGDFILTGTNPFSSLHDSLRHLELGGYVLVNLTGQSLGSLLSLDTLRLRRSKSVDVRISFHIINDWLKRKPNLQRIALEGLEISADTLGNIENPENILELSLLKAKLADNAYPDISKFTSIRRLDLRGLGTSFRAINLKPLTNLTVLLTDPLNISACNCTELDWIYEWPPYVNQGLDLFVKGINDSNKDFSLLTVCLPYCGSHGLIVSPLTIVCVLLILYSID